MVTIFINTQLHSSPNVLGGLSENKWCNGVEDVANLAF
jgi:hypothetical protein